MRTAVLGDLHGIRGVLAAAACAGSGAPGRGREGPPPGER